MTAKSTWFKGLGDAHLKKVLAERVREYEKGASLLTGAKSEPGFVFMRPPCDGNDCPDWPPDDAPPVDPCRGQHWVWQPDLAARLTLLTGCPSQAELTVLQQVLAGQLTRFNLKNPDVRASCAGGMIDILVWRDRVPPNSCSDQARKRAHVPADIALHGDFGVYVSAGLIRRLAQDAFDAAPHRLYANGFAGPDGPINLTGLAVEFHEPNVVKTIITGYDERPWPDVGFTTTITDTLSDLRLGQSESSTDVSRSDEILALLAVLMTGAILVFLPVLFPVTAFAILTELSALDRPDTPPDAGVGLRLMALLPDEISLPESGGITAPPPTTSSPMARVVNPEVRPRPSRKKLVLPYQVPRVDQSGIKVSAIAAIEDRVPHVEVTGPNALLLAVNTASTYGYFGARPKDFFGRLTFHWTASSNVVITSPSADGTRITFHRGTAKPGDHFDCTVTVRVTDVEGSTATASLVVRIFAAEPSDTIPAVCKTKPWLPECTSVG